MVANKFTSFKDGDAVWYKDFTLNFVRIYSTL